MGDTHLPRGGRRLPDGCLEVLRAASLVLHVGDFTAASVLADLEAIAPLAAVRGNMDDAALRAVLPERRVVDAQGLRIGLVHDPGPAAGRHERLLRWFPDCSVVAYGHTHVPEVTRAGETWVVNPGSPTERRRSPSHSLAVVGAGAPELVVLD